MRLKSATNCLLDIWESLSLSNISQNLSSLDLVGLYMTLRGRHGMRDRDRTSSCPFRQQVQLVVNSLIVLFIVLALFEFYRHLDSCT